MVIDVIVAIALTALDGQQVKIRPTISFYGDAVNMPASLGTVEHTVSVKANVTTLSNTVVSSTYIDLDSEIS